MAKINIERAYIESHSDDEDNFNIEVSCNDILVAKSPLSPAKWLYTITNDDGDLVINNSAGMEGSKWDYLTKEIIGDIDNG
jgi:hypothetical protein